MKAEELMIGDWVCVTKDFTQKYHKIRALSNDEGAVLRGIYVNEYGVENYSIFSPNDTEPIPLTPEILEKNGFEMVLDKDKLPTYRIKWTRNPNLYFTVFTGVDGYWNPVGYGVAIAGVNAVIDYVHQLQHAMKLCGINKEIVL